MTFREIVQRLRAAGVVQTTGCLFRDAHGERLYPCSDALPDVKAVSVMGAIWYAIRAGWITEDQGAYLIFRLDEAAREHGFVWSGDAEKAGIAFEEMAQWEASRLLARENERRPGT